VSCTLVYNDAMAGYDLGSGHPLKPERFTLAVELMRAYGLLAEEGGPVSSLDDIEPATDDELALVHDRAYLQIVRDASADPARFTWRTRRGIGPGDTPAAPGLHEASALIAGGTIAALRLALDAGGDVRPFAVAGGLHHAHHDRAAGFCVYNDPAVAIAVALRDRPELRIAYLDIDAHHGDGVQEAFYDDPRVLTISLHESGRYLYPGTGREVETGSGEGAGFALNVPLPPFADAGCYSLAFEEVVAPAIAAFAPDALVAQCGADAHHADPLTHLGLTLRPCATSTGASSRSPRRTAAAGWSARAAAATGRTRSSPAHGRCSPPRWPGSSCPRSYRSRGGSAPRHSRAERRRSRSPVRAVRLR
jgi:acetoin utilization protein AcuC